MSEVQKPRKTQKAGKNLAAFNDLQLQQLTCAKNLSRKRLWRDISSAEPLLRACCGKIDKRRMQTEKNLTSLQIKARAGYSTNDICYVIFHKEIFDWEVELWQNNDCARR